MPGIAEVLGQILYGLEFFSGLISTTSSVVFLAEKVKLHKMHKLAELVQLIKLGKLAKRG